MKKNPTNFVEVDRKIVERSNTTLIQQLISDGYVVLRKSKSTKILVLFGEQKSEEQIKAEKDERVNAMYASMEREALFLKECKLAAKKERQSQVTISNLWKNFCRKQRAYMNINKSSFYFETKMGKKVRVSDHECYHFASESERSSFSRAADFEAPDFDFVISDFGHLTRSEVVALIKKTIKDE